MMDLYLAKKAAGTFIFTKRTSPARFFNLCRILFQHYVTKPPVVSGKPIRLIIDIGNICNLSCPLCPTGQGKKGRAAGFMKYENYKRIIDELGDSLFEVDLYNWGEPLLHGELPSMIEYANKRNIQTAISSNMNRLTPELAEKLVRSGLDWITVSLDGTNAGSYGKYRVGGDIQKVLSNVKLIAETKKRLGIKTPKLIWQFLVMAHNEDETETAKGMMNETGFDELQIRPLRCDMGEEIKLDDSEKVKKTKDWLPKNGKFSRYDLKTGKAKTGTRNCLFLWIQGVVHWNGSVTPCCSIYEEKHDFGNMFEEGGFLKIWNNRKYQAARILVKRKKPVEGHVCSYCIKNGFIAY